MDTLVVEAWGLRKEYRSVRGRTRAVDGIDLAVRRGEVHGFLGPNGSGKTSTLRMLLGLTRPTSGRMALFGHPVPRGLPRVMPWVGAVVESPRFTAGLTGRQNLLLLSRSVALPDERVEAVLDAVDLGRWAGDRYRTYSLGMRQRLGIREVRELIRALAESGVTVLLSSHVLAEIQQVCTSVTVLGRGRTLAFGTVAELLAGGAEQRIVVADPERARDVLAAAGVQTRREEDRALVGAAGTPPERVTELLGREGLWVRELSPVRRDLESVYLELTAGEGLYPVAEEYLPYDVMDLRQGIDPYGYMVAVIVGCVLMFSAMTYAGADWSSGSMSTSCCSTRGATALRREARRGRALDDHGDRGGPRPVVARRGCGRSGP